MGALPWPSLFSIFFLFFKRGFLFMKKNFKLFSTISSLCLAVALMAFGVWAATQSTFKVTSKVSFTSNDVMVQWSAKVVGGDTTKNGAEVVVNVGADTNPGAAHEAEAPLGAQTFDTKSEAGLLLTYTISCTNNGTQDITVSLGTDNKLFTAVENVMSVTYKNNATDGAWAAQDITAGQTGTWVVELKLLNITANVESQDLAVSFIAAKKA